MQSNPNTSYNGGEACGIFPKFIWKIRKCVASMQRRGSSEQTRDAVRLCVDTHPLGRRSVHLSCRHWAGDGKTVVTWARCGRCRALPALWKRRADRHLCKITTVTSTMEDRTMVHGSVLTGKTIWQFLLRRGPDLQPENT